MLRFRIQIVQLKEQIKLVSKYLNWEKLWQFFAVSLDEIKEEVRKNFDKTVEWIDIPEAEQYRQSKLLNKF